MFELIKRGYLMIERRPEQYDVIIKFRFDLGLKAPLVFNERWIERGLVVLPVQIADGGAGIVPRAFELPLRMRSNYAGALCNCPGATLDDLRESVETLEDTERIARRVFGGSHPTTTGIERQLRGARAVLAAREKPSASA